MKELKLLSKIALSFKNTSNFDEDMKEILKDVGTCIDVSRIYIISNKTKEIMKNTFEWCNEGVIAQIQNLQKVKIEDVPSWMDMFLNNEYICSNDINELPQDIIHALKPQGIKSIVVYPLIAEDEIKGFIGFDECRYKRKWKSSELDLLKTVSGIISNAYERKYFQIEKTESETNFNLFFETIGDMFIISNLKGDIIHCNKAVIDKLRYSFLELKNMNLLDLHPEEQREEATMILDKMISGEFQYCPLDIESKYGDIYSVETRIWFGKWNNKDCIYSISKDVTEENENFNEKERLTNIVKDNFNKLTNIIEGTNLGTCEWYIDTGEIKINEQWAKMIGYSLEELKPTTIEMARKLTHPEDKEISRGVMEKHLNGETKNYDCQIRMKHKDGRWIWFQDRGKVSERDDSGKAVKMFGTHADITQRKEQELELERFFLVNLDLLCIVDMEGNFIKTNKAWEETLGYSSEALIGRNFLDFIHKEDVESSLEAMKQLGRNKSVAKYVNRYISSDGSYHYMEWRSKPYKDVIYSAARDITERIQYEKKIIEISNIDYLTGVYNRRYIYSRLEEIIHEYKRTGKTFSVCIIDIDNFKNINDKYGHLIGDFVLKEFTKIIDLNLRPYDILGRYGGEEFIIVLNNADKGNSNLVIERILNIVREKSFNFNGNDIKITFSAGIVNCSEIIKEKFEINDLVKFADQRMYIAKKKGKNQIISRL